MGALPPDRLVTDIEPCRAVGPIDVVDKCACQALDRIPQRHHKAAHTGSIQTGHVEVVAVVHITWK